MKILVLNAGSSSLKYKLFDGERVVFSGSVERIGEEGGAEDHARALTLAEERLIAGGVLETFSELDAVGHRVVHGGERFVAPTLVTPEVIEAIRALIPLAPLHNPANLAGIESMAERAPGVPQVAVFDTAFHQTMPQEAFLYAVPYRFYEERGVRRYGFHGTSHAYVSRRACELTGMDAKKAKLVVLHLGNGASACAVRGGMSVDTSMGFTPTAGLVMGTRCGDLDPGAVLFMEREGEPTERILEKESGLRGLCGDNDMRRVLRRAEAGDPAARRALAVYVHRIRHYVGAYFALLGGFDALVFTAAIGEKSPEIRRRVCEGLEPLGIVLDDAKNETSQTVVSADKSPVTVLVVPTDEEREIALKTRALLQR